MGHDGEPSWTAGFDWFTFHCSSCGQETFVGRDLKQSVADFREMCSWLYGSPPICSHCLNIGQVLS
jgi:hypothetical protein